MNELMQFHFVRPWWLLAIIPSAIILFYLWRNQHISGAWQKVIRADFIVHLTEGYTSKQSRYSLLWLTFAWMLAVLALAGPAWKKLPQAVYKNQNAAVVVLDLSASMYATDLAPNRFTVAKHKLLDLLKARQDGYTALVVYAGDAHVVTPLTDDINTIENMVTSISPDIMPIPGSQTPIAIKMAIDLLKQGNQSQGDIILMSDGVERDQTQQVADMVEASNITISVLAVGTIEGAPITLPNGALLKDNNGAIVTPTLTRDALQTLAKETNGIYVEAQVDDSDINALLAQLSNAPLNQQKTTNRHADTWQEEGIWLVLLLLPLAAISFRRGWLFTICLIMINFYTIENVKADIFKTPDQAGHDAFQELQYDKAAELFNNPQWKGSSYYRNEQYDKAAEAFAAEDTSQSNYNRGNALTKLQDYENAVKAYDRAIELGPTNQDAITNRTIVKTLMEQQKQQQEQEKNESSDNQEKQQPADSTQKNNQQGAESQQNKENTQANQQDDQRRKADQDKAEQSGDQGDQQSQSQSEQSSAQANDKSDQLEEKDQNTAEKTEQMNKPTEDATKQNSASGDKKENTSPTPSASMTEAEQQQALEQKQALQQWLRKVPDDPAGLLERKFRIQSQQNNSSVDTNKTW